MSALAPKTLSERIRLEFEAMQKKPDCLLWNSLGYYQIDESKFGILTDLIRLTAERYDGMFQGFILAYVMVKREPQNKIVAFPQPAQELTDAVIREIFLRDMDVNCPPAKVLKFARAVIAAHVAKSVGAR